MGECQNWAPPRARSFHLTSASFSFFATITKSALAIIGSTSLLAPRPLPLLWWEGTLLNLTLCMVLQRKKSYTKARNLPCAIVHTFSLFILHSPVNNTNFPSLTQKSKHEMYGTLLYTVTLKGRNMIFNTWQNYFCNSARVSGALICFVDCVSEDLPIAFRNDYGTTHSQRHYNFSHSLLEVYSCSTRRNIEQVMQQSSMAIDACARARDQ